MVLVPVSDRPSASHPTTAGSLRIQKKAREGRLILSLSGELDISSAPLLEEELLDASGNGTDVILDMTGVEFIDSIGLRAILRGRQACSERKCGYFLTPPQPGARRVFELTGVLDQLRLEPGGEAAEG